MTKEYTLPEVKTPATSLSPRNLIIFSKPKVGKTTLISQLDNCLTIDLETGSDFLESLRVSANSVVDIKGYGEAILAKGRPYQYIAIDTITKLEELCIPYAEILYMKTSMGKNWETKLKPEYGSILNLPNGAGYQYLRDAFINMLEYIKTLAPRVIFLGHIKDTQLEKSSDVFTSLDLDLTGKLKRIVTSQSDAIGYLYRKKDQNVLSFKTSDDIACGARPNHLKNKEIVISEIKDDKLLTHWDRVFID